LQAKCIKSQEKALQKVTFIKSSFIQQPIRGIQQNPVTFDSNFPMHLPNTQYKTQSTIEIKKTVQQLNKIKS
jgi:hypothetical protein